jgi:hypothetical protein
VALFFAHPDSAKTADHRITTHAVLLMFTGSSGSSIFPDADATALSASALVGSRTVMQFP